MVFEHDFVRFPELRNSELDFLYFDSPHKQILEDFRAEVTKVIDGDTIRVKWKDRDFDFPIRFLGTNAPELNETNGKEVQKYLERILLNQEVDIIVDRNQRVDKWGRLLGVVNHRGIDMGEDLIRTGRSTPFDDRNEGKFPNINKMLGEFIGRAV